MRRWEPEDGRDVFAEYRLDEQIAKGLERKVFLPSGGSLIIERTEAMTVIDVNTGKFTGTGGNLEATVTSNNLEAAEEIVRQLRLRDIGGIIVIDFIDMVLPNNRELLLRRLVECLGRDRTRHQVAEVTSLGLVQMTRKKIGTGLLEAFTTECPHCHGRGVELHEMPVESQKQPDGGTREPNPPRRSGPALAVSGASPPQHAEPRGRGQLSSRGRARSGQLTTETAGPGSDRRPIVVAVVGAGPSGIYAAEALSQQADVAVQVAVIDRLPVPFGLVRYGVAPDHPSIRSIRNTLERTLEKSGVRFYGDVTIGRDLSLEELRGAVDAVIYAYGAGTDKKMGIPGEDLPGSLGAPDLVAWYTGHPDVHPDPGPQLDHQRPGRHDRRPVRPGDRSRGRRRGQCGPRRGPGVDQVGRPARRHGHGRWGAGIAVPQADHRRPHPRPARARVHRLHHQGTARAGPDRRASR